MDNKDAVELAYNNGYEAGANAVSREKELEIAELKGTVAGLESVLKILFDLEIRNVANK